MSALLLLLLAPWFAAPAFAADSLEQAIAHHLPETPEFAFIRKEAERLGVRVWLFGGSAASYAHYVKWDELRRAGDPRFQKDRFDYDYTNIFRSSQDADLVLDGPPEKAEELQRLLAEKFDHLQGRKSVWEVRLLREELGDKLPLLDDPDFLGQHSDSHSTGLVEITRPAPGEDVVKDLRDWKSPDPQFLRDVREGKLHFYFSGRHGATTRAAEGKNPPIMAAVRYLTKAFQFELEMRPEDLARVQKIIREFDPDAARANPYVKAWLEKNGKKLLQNAVSVEFAKATLKKVGAIEPLSRISDPSDPVDSLAWWLAREPLPSRPLGTTGQTARELGLSVVAHDTRDLEAHESIVRAHTGEPNVFVSQENFKGERAKYGEGFYVRKGEKGAWQNGLTIKFTLDPDARLGADFDLAPGTDYLVVHNKKALRVIPESLALNPEQYFQLLSRGGLRRENRAVLEKLRRRVRNRVPLLSDEEYRRIGGLMAEELKQPRPRWFVLEEWMKLPRAEEFASIVPWREKLQAEYEELRPSLVRDYIAVSDDLDDDRRFWQLVGEHAKVASAEDLQQLLRTERKVAGVPGFKQKVFALKPSAKELRAFLSYVDDAPSLVDWIRFGIRNTPDPVSLLGALDRFEMKKDPESQFRTAQLLEDVAEDLARAGMDEAALQTFADLIPTETAWKNLSQRAPLKDVPDLEPLRLRRSRISPMAEAQLRKVIHHYELQPRGLNTPADIDLLKETILSFQTHVHTPADIIGYFQQSSLFSSPFDFAPVNEHVAKVFPHVLDPFLRDNPTAEEIREFKFLARGDAQTYLALADAGMERAKTPRDFLLSAEVIEIKHGSPISGTRTELLVPSVEKHLKHFASLNPSDSEKERLVAELEKAPNLQKKARRALGLGTSTCDKLYSRFFGL